MLFDPLLRKLASFEPLPADAMEAAIALCDDVRSIKRDKHIAREGQRPEYIHVVLSGWAIRYNLLEEGTRCISAILLPGDFSDVHATSLAVMDHSIVAVTDCMVAFVDPSRIDGIMQSVPVLLRALRRSTLVDEAILRRWFVRANRSDAEQAVGHLFCELHARASLAGLASHNAFFMPLTQVVISDALGLTPVHVNRVIRRIREAGLATADKGMLRIHDLPALRSASGFDPTYLHLQRPQTQP